MSRLAALVVVASATALVAAAVACGSSSGGSAATCAVDAGAPHDAFVDTGAVADAAGSDAGPTDAGLACEAGSVASMGQCTNVAGSLEGLRWELPCTMPGGTICTTLYDGGDVRVVSTKLAGTPGQTYSVTLHFRGVAEMKTYVEDDAGAPQNAGAMGVANAQFFVSGGAWPADGFNVYELEVSDPPGVYFVNSGVSNIHNVWWLDYAATIAMKAEATVTLTADSLDNLETANVNGLDGGPVLVPGVPPYPQAYDGQFIQVDVVSVEEMP